MICKKLLSVFVWSLFVTACASKRDLPEFETQKWVSDKKACNQVRKEMQPAFEKIRKDLYGRSEQEILEILGPPDGEQLMARSQRIFYYYIEQGSQCVIQNQLSDANKAEVRFNALQNVSEITYTRPISY